VVSIGFIGGGKMAEALIACSRSPKQIIVSDISKKRLSYLKKKYKIKLAKDNAEVFKKAKVVILAVKPQNVRDVLRGLSRAKSRETVVISIAAGIPLSYLQKKLPGLSIIRAMPNNPCLVGMGITALAKGKKVKSKEFKQALKIFDGVGEVVVVPEKWMDAVTGLSGSGPAYIYECIEGLAHGGVKAGLSPSISAKLTLMTVLGAAFTVLNTGKSPKELKAMVTSPGGTTIEGLKMLKKRKFSKALIEAVNAAAKKSKKLSKKWTL
jgi:pyrroline-5-carboxylate reductase